MSKQVLIWRNIAALSTSAIAYCGLGNSQQWNALEPANGSYHWGAAGTFSNLTVTIGAAPGTGDSRQFWVRINGADSALTVTISDAATTATLTGVSVAVSAWDIVSIKSDPSGTPAATSDVWVSVDFDSTTPGEQCYGLASSAAYAATVTNRVFFPSHGLNSSTSALDIAAVSGTINGYGVYVDRAILAGTWTYVIFKNGVQQDGSGGTVDTRLTSTVGSPQGQTVTFSLPVTAGDIFLFQVQETVSATAMQLSWGVLFTASTPGQFMLGASLSGPWTSAGNLYSRLTGGNAVGADATETNMQVVVGVTPFYLSTFRIQVNGTLNSVTFTLRKNAAATALTATVTSTAASDLAHQVLCASGDLLALEGDPTGAPTSRTGGFSFGANTTPSVTAVSWGFVGTQAGMAFTG